MWNRLLISLVGSALLTQAAQAESARPIIIIQAPVMSDAEFVATQSGALASVRGKGKPAAAATTVAAPVVTPVAPVAAAAAPATTEREALPASVSDDTPVASVADDDTAAAAAAPVEPVVTMVAPVPVRAAAPLPVPAHAVVVPQPTQVSGAAFIAAHAPPGMANPVPNLKLMITGKDGKPLHDAAVALTDTDDHTALKTLVCTDALLAHVPPGTYRLNIGYDRITIAQNITVVANAITSYTVGLPIDASPDGGAPKHPSAAPTPLHELLDTLNLTRDVVEQRCP